MADLDMWPWKIPSIHYWMVKFYTEHPVGEDSKEYWENNKNKHKDHPICRVPGKRRFKCTSDPTEVTCRACLKRMALAVQGEQKWREKIIGCYGKGARPYPKQGKSGMVLNSLLEQGFTEGGRP